MSRSRQLTVAAAAEAAKLQAHIALGLRDGVSNRDPRVIENNGQAMPKGAQIASRDKRMDRKAKSRAATLELVAVSNQTLVVAHLHPRWLRQAVEDMMDAGANIDLRAVELLKSHGREGARMIVEAYDGGSLYVG